jgi:PadR family transcriptional regulator, regulatory protein PadR
MESHSEVWQGTLSLMILKVLDSMGKLHGYGIARRIEQVSGDRLMVRYGTIYPALLKLEQEGYVSSAWGASENNRRAKYYSLTKSGRKQIERVTSSWRRTADIVERFIDPKEQGI